MMLLLIVCFIFPVTGSVWKTLTDSDCYHCVQYISSENGFTAQGLIGSKLIVGGRNTIIKLDFTREVDESFPDTDLSRRNMKDVAYNDYQYCIDAGRSEDMCANYYKVIIPIDTSTLLLCGTSAYNPQCDFRQVSDLSYSKRKDVVSGEGLCPADPAKSVSFTKISEGVGFAGTCREVCDVDAISRMNLQAGSLVATARTFRTAETLSGAHFIYSFESGDFVYFLFKETALEEKRENVFSRVGRLCKNDVGSSNVLFKDFFKTFLKVRIYCTSNQPGETPFVHNELGGAWFQDDILYTVFSGPTNLSTGSILCMYTMHELQAAFKGRYQVHDTDTNKWKVKENPSPVQCSTHPTVLNASKVVLMLDPIYSSTPLFYTDTRLSGLLGRTLDAFQTSFYQLFSSNDQGEVIRITYQKENVHIIHDQTFKIAETAILSIVQDEENVFALSATSVTMIPSVFDCSKPSTCQSCVSHYYPMCGWCHSADSWSCTPAQSCKHTWVSPLDTCEDSPVFTEFPKNETLREGESLLLKCGARNNHPFFWTRTGGPLPRKSKLMESDYLLVPLLKAEDEACYQCNMNNTSGPVVAEACIKVLVAPRFVEEGKPVDTKIQLGYSNLLLPCTGVGSPIPTSTWQRIGSKLPEGSMVMEDGTLKLIRVMAIDAGEYKCTIANQEGSLDVTITLLVENNAKIKTNGTEEQYNGNQINKRTMITLIICVLVVVLCFIMGFAAFSYRRNRKRNRHGVHYLENDNPMALDSPLNTMPLTNIHGHWNNMHNGDDLGMSPGIQALSALQEVEDEAPPAYSEQPQIMRSLSHSDYHLLSFPQPSPSPDSFLYQPLAQINTDFRPPAAPLPPRGGPPKEPAPLPPRTQDVRTTPIDVPQCRTPQHEYSTAIGHHNPPPGGGILPPPGSNQYPPQGGSGPPPRFITSLPDNSPAFISTLPGDAIMTSQHQLNNEPPD